MSVISRLQIPIWREGRFALERGALLRDAVWRGEGLTRGHGEPVMLIAGFMAGDLSLAAMARWLRRLGYRPVRAGLRANVDCTEETLQRLERELEQAVARHGSSAWIVGHSRGGTMARVLAVRRPDLVTGIVCLGSPLQDQFEVHPLVRAQVRAVAMLGTLGVPGLFRHRCRDECCAEAHEQLAGPFPDDVAFTSIFSRSDGVVGWRACLDPAAQAIEVDASHCGMAVNREVYRELAGALSASRSCRAEAEVAA
jgi:pimeloyl-ACP methyl ester carboxylesterase